MNGVKEKMDQKMPCKNCLVLPICLSRKIIFKRNGIEILSIGRIAHNCDILMNYLFKEDDFTLYRKRSVIIETYFNEMIEG